MLKAIISRLEAVFRWAFRRTALRDYAVRGNGFIERKSDGARIPFVIRGDVVDGILDAAMTQVARTLYGPLGEQAAA